jgi:hypothetical protein
MRWNSPRQQGSRGIVVGNHAGQVQIVHINFMAADKTLVDATVARTVDRSFECFRREGEDLNAFKSRATDEARATNPRGPMVLIFPREPREL